MIKNAHDFNVNYPIQVEEYLTYVRAMRVEDSNALKVLLSYIWLLSWSAFNKNFLVAKQEACGKLSKVIEVLKSKIEMKVNVMKIPEAMGDFGIKFARHHLKNRTMTIKCKGLSK